MDELSGLRSFKVGSFRIIYRMKGSEHLELVAIGPRERIYEETFKDHSKRGKNVIDGLLWVSPFCPSKKSGVSDNGMDCETIPDPQGFLNIFKKFQTLRF